ncbi:MAG: lipoyl(octanoyl) transferase LipB [Bacteroidota bacterium]
MNNLINKEIAFIDLGLIDYSEAWEFQTNRHESIISKKIKNRSGATPEEITENYLIFCEHKHVFTLGKSGDEKNLVIPKEELSSIRASYHQINRGGDITYHGPGQLVGYPILDLENFFTDIHLYMRNLEEAVILTLRDFGIEAGRIQGLTGVWLDGEKTGRARKICAMGVKTSRWVTLHGLALNVNTDLNYFNYIIPCGISDKAVTSMQKELGREVSMEEVKKSLNKNFMTVFGATAKAPIGS